LAARGHDVHFITYANPIRLDPGVPRIHYHEVDVSTYPLFQYPPYSEALASRMYEVSERYHLDVLHVHYAIPHSVSAFLAKQIAAPKRRLPFITTLHGTDITIVGADPALFPTTKWSIEQSDGITAISDFVKRRTEDFFHVHCPIDVIRNFVNCNIYKPDPERRSKRKRLMHVSNFRPVKRVLDCIRILAEVRKHVDAELVMVGDGPDRGPAETLARELRVDEDVDFMGKQDHVERLFPQAHVLLMPSEVEAFGLAALEAMACGTPPVATNCGGVPELITPGVDGFLEPVGDTMSQAARVIELLFDTSMYDRMAAAARHTAEARFCADKIIPKYERHYVEVINA
jgi:N-acetyl-alpha-D-glucosaminyl L-malate synthase BshA